MDLSESIEAKKRRLEELRRLREQRQSFFFELLVWVCRKGIGTGNDDDISTLVGRILKSTRLSTEDTEAETPSYSTNRELNGSLVPSELEVWFWISNHLIGWKEAEFECKSICWAIWEMYSNDWTSRIFCCPCTKRVEKEAGKANCISCPSCSYSRTDSKEHNYSN